MTWYIWVFLSMVTGSLETIIDKASILRQSEKIDVLCAMFYRNFGFFVAAAIIGLTGLFGKMTFVFNIPFLLLAVIWPINSYTYDYSLRNIEVSRFGGIFYTFPLIFLFVDKTFFHASYSATQVLGVLLLVLGALLFTFHASPKDGRNMALSKKEIGFMLVRMIPQIALMVVYKYYSATVNDVSFYFSVWAMLMVIFVVWIVATKKYTKLKETALTEKFLAKTFLSKSFDALCSIFYFEALGLASLTVVSSLNSFNPLIMLLFLLLFSRIAKKHIDEDLSGKTLGLKIVATLTLIAGGVCMFLI